MNYELAKKLQEAGFPQGTGDYLSCHEKVNVYTEEGVEYVQCSCGAKLVYNPTLSELIEACGYGFRSLTRHTEHNKKREEAGLEKEGRVWMAKAGKKSGGFLKSGHTPEAAVARLWLELNKKV